MIVFKTVFSIVKQYKATILLYTIILIIFAGFQFEIREDTSTFVDAKPDIYIMNHDEEIGITNDFIQYMKKHSNYIVLENGDFSIEDALFYRDINYLIEIPSGFRETFLAGNSPEIKIQTTGDYQGTLAEQLVQKYMQVAGTLQRTSLEETELLKRTNEILSHSTQMEVMSKLDTNALSAGTFYFNFLNYSILAGCVYVICLIIASFKEKKVWKRMLISGTSPDWFQRNLLFSTSFVAVLLWLCYILLALFLLGDVMFSIHGFLYMINSFVFTFCALAFAHFIGNLVESRNAIQGIINVVALGSSFLCGSFVPREYLPESVVQLSKLFPSSWYIQNNELIKNLEVIQFKVLEPFFINSGIILIFMVLFILGTKMVARRKRQIG